MDPFEDFADIEPSDVDGHIERIVELDKAGELDGNEVIDMKFEALANRIVMAGGDVDDFNTKLNELELNVKFAT